MMDEIKRLDSRKTPEQFADDLATKIRECKRMHLKLVHLLYTLTKNPDKNAENSRQEQFLRGKILDFELAVHAAGLQESRVRESEEESRTVSLTIKKLNDTLQMFERMFPNIREEGEDGNVTKLFDDERED